MLFLVVALMIAAVVAEETPEVPEDKLKESIDVAANPDKTIAKRGVHVHVGHHPVLYHAPITHAAYVSPVVHHSAYVHHPTVYHAPIVHSVHHASLVHAPVLAYHAPIVSTFLRK